MLGTLSKILLLLGLWLEKFGRKKDLFAGRLHET
jgi:hypothetical protein